MENKKINTPFLNLLKEENLRKINIDAQLIPIFKIVISKLNDYFLEHDLMNAKNLNDLFNIYLLTQNNGQLKIKTGDLTYQGAASGEYSHENNTITLKCNGNDSEQLISSLCHEFIHFMVMADSNSFNAKISDSEFFNEGLTEKLVSDVIHGGKFISGYNREVQMAEFYILMANNKNPYQYFLRDQFYFDDDYNAPPNLIRSSEKFNDDNKLESIQEIQRVIIRSALDEYSIYSLNDYINLITKINKRPYFDGQYIDSLFERITDKYLMFSDFKEEEKDNIKQALLIFCKLSNKKELYGDNEVAEFLIDDLHIAFDKQANHYNEYPLSGNVKRGQVGFDGQYINITHKDKMYKIKLEDMKCKNWSIIYDEYLNQLENMIHNSKNNHRVK